MTTKLPITLLKPSGMAGQVLTSNGPNDPPEWAAGGGGSSANLGEPWLSEFGDVVADGVEDNAATVAAALASDATAINVPDGIVHTTASPITRSVAYRGPGTLKRTYKYAPRLTVITSAVPPLPPTGFDVPDTAFDADFAYNTTALDHRVLAAFANPPTGYQYNPLVMPHVNYFTQGANAGHNQSANSNDGRTGNSCYYVKGDNYGKGDFGAFTAQMGVYYSDPTKTHWLAQPACSIIGGNCAAYVDNVYLNPQEMQLQDNGHNVACIGPVINMERKSNALVTSSTNGMPWIGLLLNSHNNPTDIGLKVAGKVGVGLDLTSANLLQRNGSVSNAAITMKADQKIFLDAPPTDFPVWSPLHPGAVESWKNTFISYTSNNGRILFAVDNSAPLLLGKTRSEFNGGLQWKTTTGHTILDFEHTSGTQLYIGNSAMGYQVELSGVVKYNSLPVSPSAGAAAGFVQVQIEDTVYKLQLFANT